MAYFSCTCVTNNLALCINIRLTVCVQAMEHVTALSTWKKPEMEVL